MEPDSIDHALKKISETEKNLDKLQEKQTYLETVLDALLNVKKETLLSKSFNVKKIIAS